MFCFFFFKQKTAYEMRISDWSSDVCSSDLQMMFAKQDGAVAAPTAALHFTPALLDAIAAAGIGTETLTLHVGAGTFLPVKADDTDAPVMHAAWGRLADATAARLQSVRAAGGRGIRSAERRVGEEGGRPGGTR